MNAADGGAGGHRRPSLGRSFALLNKSWQAFYDGKFERSVECCLEALTLLLPAEGRAGSPEEQGSLFLSTYATSLPVLEADEVAAVFSFFQNRTARFRYRRDRPLPKRDWWQLLHVTRDEAAGVLNATAAALGALKTNLSPERG